jgi:ubiquitin carboxyl-terminal hydrolase 25/28
MLIQTSVQPERTEEFKNAVETIADNHDSIPLKTFLIDMITTPDSTILVHANKEQQAGPGSAEHPVGLENIAQTCYMNSLFQYYFSVRPLRNAILSFEEHAEGDLTDDQLKKKQISKLELERSKRCI